MKDSREIAFDDVTPASYAYLVDTRKAFLLQQGGLMTRIHYRGARQTTLEDFIANEVPKLKPDTGALHVIRSLEHGSLSLVLGDQVITYDVDTLEEAGLDDFIGSLEHKPELSVVPDVPYPIIKYSRSDDGVSVTVLVSNYSFLFRSQRVGKDFSTRIHMPPFWLTVDMSTALMFKSAGLVAVPQPCLRAYDTKLKRWPLPNVFGSGSVCMGETRLADSGGDGSGSKVTLGSVIDATMNRIFNSDWNVDLFSGVESEGLGDLNPGRAEYYSKLKATKPGIVCSLLDTLRVLELPEGWRELKYVDFPKKAKEYLDGRGD